MPLLQYEFIRVAKGGTTLTGITEISKQAQLEYPTSFFPGATMYWIQSAAPGSPCGKVGPREETERWYACTDVDEDQRIEEVLRLLTTLPFWHSMGDKGEAVFPVRLPVSESYYTKKEKPLGKRGIVVYMRHD
jgi:hypothetical protein